MSSRFQTVFLFAVATAISVACFGEDSGTKPPDQKAGAPQPGDSKPAVKAAPDSAEVPTLPEVIVEGHAEVKAKGREEDIAQKAQSASQGVVGAEEIQDRPLLRPGETMETIPGMIVTQHSGSGKANQYFFRGFNLDHGTDFATWLDGMPINMRTHAHGQGYTDLNFMMPELVQSIAYSKGSYYAEEGDFSSTGAAHINYVTKLDDNFTETTAGSYGYVREFLAGSTPFKGGHVLGALELERNDGPWAHSECLRKANGVLSYSRGDETCGWHITAMGYTNTWTSSDQIPLRAVQEGLISRFGEIDPSDGGRTLRNSLSAEWHQKDKDSETRINAYVIQSDLNLWNDFTYFLVDPVNGDQFEQVDRRVVTGVHGTYTRRDDLGGHPVQTIVGLDIRNDDITESGLFHTKQRAVLSTTLDDRVLETSISPFIQSEFQVLEKFHAVAGLREDVFTLHVHSDNPLNSGNDAAHLESYKTSLVFGPWAKTEWYLNFGTDFHSNDGRGVTETINPQTGGLAQKSPLLVQTVGEDLGVRTTFIPHLNTTLAAFGLHNDSELVFDGDTGTTTPSGPSQRLGVEFANYYTPLKWLTFDFDLALDRARFTDNEPAGELVPEAVHRVTAAGITVNHPSGFFGALRLRDFGPRPLTQNGSVQSHSTDLLEVRAGYHFNKRCTLSLDVFNLLDRKASDIDYYYTSRLPGEPAAGVADIHFHPVEPREFRVTFTLKF